MIAVSGRLAGRLMRLLASSLILNATFPIDVFAQTTPAAAAQPATAQPFNAEQLDALVASIALYPDELLTQVLDGLDVSAGSRGRGALGGRPGAQVTDRGRFGQGAGSRAVGPEREVAGADSRRHWRS